MQPNIPRTVSTTNQRVYGVGGRGDEAANDDVVKDVAAGEEKKWQEHSILYKWGKRCNVHVHMSV